jgi:hypothetical protein
MVDAVNNAANINALTRGQAASATAFKNTARTSPIQLDSTASSGKSSKSQTIIQAGASPSTNLPRGSIVDKLV